MDRWRGFRYWLLAVGVWLLWLPSPAGGPAAAGSRPEAAGVHVILSREFFEALHRLERSPGITYGERQEALLEKIALSCQYLVKTNLTLIEQQERLLRLLEGQARARGQER